MHFLVDAQLPPALARWLSKRGFIARTAKDAGPRDTGDSAIRSYAIANEMAIVTEDEDFALLAAVDDGPKVLWVRTGNIVNRLLLARFEDIWPQIEAHFASGARSVELR